MWTDHAWTSIALQIQNIEQTTKIWRFDNFLLKDEKTYQRVAKHITDYFIDNDRPETSEIILWDALKPMLKGQLIALTERKQERNRLIAETAKLENLQRQGM